MIPNSDLKLAINSLAAIPFFPPKDEMIARAKVAESLQSMCADTEQLNWLVFVAISRMKAWGGVAGLREILSTKFAPADGLMIEAKDPEQLYLEREAAETKAKLEQWNRESRLLTGTVEEPARCPVCDWPLAATVAEGCVPGNCSYRPPEGTSEYQRIKERRKSLREIEAEVAALQPTLTDDIKARRIRIIEAELANKTRLEREIEAL
jgi:hypothetical protein